MVDLLFLGVMEALDCVDLFEVSLAYCVEFGQLHLVCLVNTLEVVKVHVLDSFQIGAVLFVGCVALELSHIVLEGRYLVGAVLLHEALAVVHADRGLGRQLLRHLQLSVQAREFQPCPATIRVVRIIIGTSDQVYPRVFHRLQIVENSF